MRSNGRPKIVLFWNMQVEGDTCFKPSREVDVFEWMSWAAACGRLDYALERQLVAELVPPPLAVLDQ